MGFFDSDSEDSSDDSSSFGYNKKAPAPAPSPAVTTASPKKKTSFLDSSSSSESSSSSNHIRKTNLKSPTTVIETPAASSTVIPKKKSFLDSSSSESSSGGGASSGSSARKTKEGGKTESAATSNESPDAADPATSSQNPEGEPAKTIASAQDTSPQSPPKKSVLDSSSESSSSSKRLSKEQSQSRAALKATGTPASAPNTLQSPKKKSFFDSSGTISSGSSSSESLKKDQDKSIAPPEAREIPAPDSNTPQSPKKKSFFDSSSGSSASSSSNSLKKDQNRSTTATGTPAPAPNNPQSPKKKSFFDSSGTISSESSSSKSLRKNQSQSTAGPKATETPASAPNNPQIPKKKSFFDSSGTISSGSSSSKSLRKDQRQSTAAPEATASSPNTHQSPKKKSFFDSSGTISSGSSSSKSLKKDQDQSTAVPEAAREELASAPNTLQSPKKKSFLDSSSGSSASDNLPKENQSVGSTSSKKLSTSAITRISSPETKVADIAPETLSEAEETKEEIVVGGQLRDMQGSSQAQPTSILQTPQTKAVEEIEQDLVEYVEEIIEEEIIEEEILGEEVVDEKVSSANGNAISSEATRSHPIGNGRARWGSLISKLKRKSRRDLRGPLTVKFRDPPVTELLEYRQFEDSPFSVNHADHVAEDYDEVPWYEEDYEELPWHMQPDLDEDDAVTALCKKILVASEDGEINKDLLEQRAERVEANVLKFTLKLKNKVASARNLAATTSSASVSDERRPNPVVWSEEQPQPAHRPMSATQESSVEVVSSRTRTDTGQPVSKRVPPRRIASSASASSLVSGPESVISDGSSGSSLGSSKNVNHRLSMEMNPGEREMLHSRQRFFKNQSERPSWQNIAKEASGPLYSRIPNRPNQPAIILPTRHDQGNGRPLLMEEVPFEEIENQQAGPQRRSSVVDSGRKLETQPAKPRVSQLPSLALPVKSSLAKATSNDAVSNDDGATPKQRRWSVIDSGYKPNPTHDGGYRATGTGRQQPPEASAHLKSKQKLRSPSFESMPPPPVQIVNAGDSNKHFHQHNGMLFTSPLSQHGPSRENLNKSESSLIYSLDDDDSFPNQEQNSYFEEDMSEYSVPFDEPYEKNFFQDELYYEAKKRQGKPIKRSKPRRMSRDPPSHLNSSSRRSRHEAQRNKETLSGEQEQDPLVSSVNIGHANFNRRISEISNVSEFDFPSSDPPSLSLSSNSNRVRNGVPAIPEEPANTQFTCSFPPPELQKKIQEAQIHQEKFAATPIHIPEIFRQGLDDLDKQWKAFSSKTTSPVTKCTRTDSSVDSYYTDDYFVSPSPTAAASHGMDQIPAKVLTEDERNHLMRKSTSIDGTDDDAESDGTLTAHALKHLHDFDDIKQLNDPGDIDPIAGQAGSLGDKLGGILLCSIFIGVWIAVFVIVFKDLGAPLPAQITNGGTINPAPTIASTPAPAVPSQSPMDLSTAPSLDLGAAGSQLQGLLPASTWDTILFNAESPQRQALEWLQTQDNEQYSEGRMVQRFALATLYFATDGIDDGINDFEMEPPSTRRLNATIDEEGSFEADTTVSWFGVDGDECAGDEGIVCDATGTLQQLTLGDRNLQGTLPPELGLLKDLLRLDMGVNVGLQGRIPSEIGLLALLQSLDLHENGLTGPIPSEIGRLNELFWLNLAEQNQNSEWDDEKNTTLRKLSSTIPTELGRLTKLEHLRLQNNHLQGSIPLQFQSLKKLKTANLDYNILSGNIPRQLGSLVELRALSLNFNNLSGRIPEEISNIPNLMELHLMFNKLTGTLPASMSVLSESLAWISLGENLFTGTLPVWWSELSKLQVLHLENNVGLTGTIPFDWGFNWVEIQRIWLHGTSLQGEVPLGLCFIKEDPEFVLETISISCETLSCSCNCFCA